jgi:hypothetical protein
VDRHDKVVHAGMHQGDGVTGDGSFSPAWRLSMVESNVEAVRCSSRCSGSSTGTRGSFGAWRWKRRELRRARPWWPVFNGGRRRGAATPRSPKRKTEMSTYGEVVVSLFTTGKEKLKCGRLTATPATRLDREAPGS